MPVTEKLDVRDQISEDSTKTSENDGLRFKNTYFWEGS